MATEGISLKTKTVFRVLLKSSYRPPLDLVTTV